METLHQRDRRELEIHRYPHLASEIIRRDAAFCQHMSEVWQQLILTPLAERLIPARVNRPVAFETFGHWGPWAHTENWGGLATARFMNEASMLSWLIASYHIAGNFCFYNVAFWDYSATVCASPFQCWRTSENNCFGRDCTNFCSA